jgi:cytochrome d ubiquinol oxidase subunit II
MTLNDVWYALFIVIVAGYLILDGFDLGVGILQPFVAKSDAERRIVLNSIGPIWDGNEVWLVLLGGVLFAVFPFAYASLFSGFYVAFMLVLLGLILRAVSIEFRSQRPSAGWRSLWDYVFFGSSLALALLFGVAFGDILLGVPLSANGTVTVNLIDLLSPFALLVGVTTAFMFAMHGALYLVMKTEGALQSRVRSVLPAMLAAFFVLNTVVVLFTMILNLHVQTRYLHDIWPIIFPALALGALIVTWQMLRVGRYITAFVASSAMIALLIVSVGIGQYPDLLISTTSSKYTLTATNAASQNNTLTVCLIIALIGMPFVILYSAGAYYIFRGKVRIESESY